MAETPSANEVLAQKDREFAAYIAEKASDFMIVKYARETIEVQIERNERNGAPMQEMDRALCKRLQALQDRLAQETRNG